MRPTRIELATFGLKGLRRKLVIPVGKPNNSKKSSKGKVKGKEIHAKLRLPQSPTTPSLWEAIICRGQHRGATLAVKGVEELDAGGLYIGNVAGYQRQSDDFRRRS
jgi:hypothetical protein